MARFLVIIELASSKVICSVWVRANCYDKTVVSSQVTITSIIFVRHIDRKKTKLISAILITLCKLSWNE